MSLSIFKKIIGLLSARLSIYSIAIVLLLHGVGVTEVCALMYLCGLPKYARLVIPSKNETLMNHAIRYVYCLPLYSNKMIFAVSVLVLEV